MNHVAKPRLQTTLPGQTTLPRSGTLPLSRVDAANAWLFLRRWVANPLQMGSVIPSSPALCRRVAAQVRRREDQYVLELGAGTGVISQALLASNVPAEKLIVVEIVPSMADHLRRVLPGSPVLTGDARDLPALLPDALRGRIGSVVCGIPLVLLPLAEQRRFIDAMQAVAPGVGFLHYSYCITSPLPAAKHALVGRREAWTPLNVPPASVWRYTPRQDAKTANGEAGVVSSSASGSVAPGARG